MSARKLRATARSMVRRVLPLVALSCAPVARASLFSGDTLDFVADVLAWIVLFVAPVMAIGVFWIVHILPEQIAEKRHHPQAPAIKTLCFLSLVFGGMLWPFAWLWAYSKPVLYKMAYGKDTEPPHPEQNPTSEAVITEPEVVVEAPVAAEDVPVLVESRNEARRAY